MAKQLNRATRYFPAKKEPKHGEKTKQIITLLRREQGVTANELVEGGLAKNKQAAYDTFKRLIENYSHHYDIRHRPVAKEDKATRGVNFYRIEQGEKRRGGI